MGDLNFLWNAARRRHGMDAAQLLGNGSEQKADFLLHLLFAVDSLGDFLAHELAEAAAQPVNVRLDGILGQFQPPGRVPVGQSGFVHAVKTLQLLEQLGLSLGGIFLVLDVERDWPVARTWPAHDNWIWDVRWSPDGARLVSAGADSFPDCPNITRPAR
jgi:hypothetical protein